MSVVESRARKKIHFERSVETYNVVLDSISALIQEGGLEAVTIPSVSKKSGFAVGTLYLYFDNKESLLEALLRRVVFQVSGRAQKEILPILYKEPREVLLKFFEVLLEDNEFKIHRKLFGMIPLIESTYTGVSISQLVLRGIEKEISTTLGFDLDPAENKKVSFILLNTLRGLLSVDPPTDTKAYAEWLTEITFIFLDGKKVKT